MNNDDLKSEFHNEVTKLVSDGWVVLYSHIKKGEKDFVSYSTMIDQSRIKKSLEDYTWDFHIGDNPRDYFSEGVVPLTFNRQWYGVKKDYWDLLEDFKLFFNLFEDKDKKTFLFIDESGDEESVIIIDETVIKVKQKFLLEYLLKTKRCLVQFFDFRYFFKKSLEDNGLKEETKEEKRNDLVTSFLVKGDKAPSYYESFASLIGKKIITPPDDFCFTEPLIHEEFIIGVDQQSGKEKYFTCDREKLSNFYVDRDGAPNYYLTPVSFKKKVLDKYYSEPSKYSVNDGVLFCGGLWSLRMDNSHKNYVNVLLGDLSHLPLKEQKHWKNHNILPQPISRISFMRNFMAEFCPPDTPDLYLKSYLKWFNKKWFEKFGWPLFNPLKKGDEHYFKELRLPTKQDQAEFDSLVQGLTKIIIDSLNEKELVKGLIKESDDETKRELVPNNFILVDGDKGISKLNKFLYQKHKLSSEGLIDFLRNLQELRSSGTAHRKGKSYSKIKQLFGLKDDNFKEVFEDILINCIKVLNTLSSKCLGGAQFYEKTTK